MDIEKLLKGFGRTKRHLTSAVIGAAGWEIRQFDAEASSGPQVFLYVFDKPTGFTWMGAIPRDEFVRISTLSSREPNKIDAVRNGLTGLLYHAAATDASMPDCGHEWELQLATLMSAYAGTTKTWVEASRMLDGGHFVVLNYRISAASENSMLRPFVLRDTGSVLSVERLQECIQKVLERDLDVHPEWFR